MVWGWVILVVIIDFLLGVIAGVLVKGKSDTWKSLIFVKDLLVTIFYFVMIYLFFKLVTFNFVMEIIEILLGSLLFLIGILITIFIIGLALGNFFEYLRINKK